MKCLNCSAEHQSGANFCSNCGKALQTEIEWIQNSSGKKHLADAFSAETIRLSVKLANDEKVQSAFARYVLNCLQEPRSVLQLKSEFRDAVAEQARRNHIQPTHELIWCVLSVCTDRYFLDKSTVLGWTQTDADRLKEEWYDLLDAAFLESAVKKFDIAAATRWQEKFLKQQQAEYGPLSACSSCTSKCLYHSEVSAIVSAEQIKADYIKCTANEFTTPQEAAAIFCNLLALKFMDDPSIDFQFCFAAHLVSIHELSDSGQVFLAGSIREKLLEQAGISTENLEAEKGPDIGVADFAKFSLRRQVLDLIVKQAVAGFDWRTVFAETMKNNDISIEDVENEIRKSR